MKRIGLAGIAGLLSLGSVHAATLIPVPQVPGSAPGGTAVRGINDDNVIVGQYYTPDGVEHGFFGTLNGDYVTFDFGVSYTEPRSINNRGLIMGRADDADGFDVPFERYADGSITLVEKDGAPLGQGIPGAINAKGIFVAYGYDRNFHKYLSFYGQNAEYAKAIRTPGLGQPAPKGIDDFKNVVGFYTGDDGLSHGFLLKDGTLSIVDYPDPDNTGTLLYGINDSGAIVGGWNDSKGRVYSFIYDSSTGQFTPLEEKGVKDRKFAQAFGINNKGLVAVNFAGGPFIYCPRKPSKCPAGGFEIADEPSVQAGVVLTRKAPPPHNAALAGKVARHSMTHFQ